MKCKNCGKDIDESEVFCDDCKNHLREVSSREDVTELEQLIENQDKFQDLENTKELDNLKDLKENTESSETEIPMNLKREDINKDVATKKPLNKKLIIIIIVSIIVVLSIIVTIIIFLPHEKPKNNVDTVDYKQVINEYGKSIEKNISLYMEENDGLPTWEQLEELNDYKKYKVSCDVHMIYEDGSIYLSSCSVDDKAITHTYGELKDIKKDGRQINIYKVTSNGSDSYTAEEQDESQLVGKVTCETNDCQYLYIYSKYIIIEENGKYYLYDYEDSSVKFGPFNMNKDNSIVSKNYNLYAILYTEDNKQNIYNVDTGKIFKGINGSILRGDTGFDPTVMYKYGYVILANGSSKDFVNFKTGKVGFSIKDNIRSFVEDSKNSIVYITAYNTNYNKFKVYNSNGKLLFDGKEYTDLKIIDKDIIVLDDVSFRVYNSKLVAQTISKNYNKLLGLYDNYIAVIDDGYLKILNLNEKELATSSEKWDLEKFEFNSSLSGLITKDGKQVLLIVADNKIGDSDESRVEYSFQVDSNEIVVSKTKK